MANVSTSVRTVSRAHLARSVRTCSHSPWLVGRGAMPVTVGTTSPLPGESQAKVKAARKRAGATARRLSTALSQTRLAGSSSRCNSEGFINYYDNVRGI